MRSRATLLSVATATPLLLMAAGATMAGVAPPSNTPSTAPSRLAATASPRTVRRSGTTCLRWRKLASRLGETYAGYQLRTTVATRLCAFADDVVEDTAWSWPWRHRDVRADLPPLLHGTYGSWEIRCSEVGRRRRCALALETVAAASLEPEAWPVRIVAHVVIDSIGGRESVLWRVHVAHDGRASPLGDSVRLVIGGKDIAEPYDACGRRGCIAEAGPKQSAEVASWLWSGRSLQIAIGRTSDGIDLTGQLPAHGFRSGLGELINLRRQEGRALAGR